MAVSSKFCTSYAESLSNIFIVLLLDSTDVVIRQIEDGVADKEGTVNEDIHGITLFKASFSFSFFLHVPSNFKLRNRKFY